MYKIFIFVLCVVTIESRTLFNYIRRGEQNNFGSSLHIRRRSLVDPFMEDPQLPPYFEKMARRSADPAEMFDSPESEGVFKDEKLSRRSVGVEETTVSRGGMSPEFWLRRKRRNAALERRRFSGGIISYPWMGRL
ncbi:hypothetical protein JTB14_037327 [Gonioctena quinquepunctata]|nr:hypothetical protein JTB14_037327 [Gonioctena quinquepunctata]